MTDLTPEYAREQVDRMVRSAVDLAYPGCDGRLLQLERVAYATAQAKRHADSERFGNDHPMTVAYLECAQEDALKAFVHTSERIDAALEAEAPKTEDGA